MARQLAGRHFLQVASGRFRNNAGTGSSAVMTISNFSLVNQRLAFAKALYGLVTDVAMNAERLRCDALLSGCVFQLSCAFHFYLREIADRVYLKNSGTINSLDDLVLSLIHSDKFSSEIAELDELSKHPGSWLEQLLCYEAALFNAPRKEREKKAFQQDNLIVAVDITEIANVQPVVLTVERVGLWLDLFCALVLRQRDTSAEF